MSSNRRAQANRLHYHNQPLGIRTESFSGRDARSQFRGRLNVLQSSRKPCVVDVFNLPTGVDIFVPKYTLNRLCTPDWSGIQVDEREFNYLQERPVLRLRKEATGILLGTK